MSELSSSSRVAFPPPSGFDHSCPIVIADPKSGRREGARVLAELLSRFEEEGHPRPEHHREDWSGIGERAAELLSRGGTQYLIVVGSDRTLRQVMQGLVDQDLAAETVVGYVGVGESEFARTFGLKRQIRDLVTNHLNTESAIPVDIGVAETTLGNRATEQIFLNAAEVGWGADVVHRWVKRGHSGSKLGKLVAAWRAIRATDPPPVTLGLAHTEATVQLVQLVLANGQFLPERMHVAPRALPDDAKLNVLAFTGSPSQYFSLSRDMRLGEHLPSPEIAEWQSETVTVEVDGPALPVALDGTPMGTTPARFSLQPKKLWLKI